MFSYLDSVLRNCRTLALTFDVLSISFVRRTGTWERIFWRGMPRVFTHMCGLRRLLPPRTIWWTPMYWHLCLLWFNIILGTFKKKFMLVNNFFLSWPSIIKPSPNFLFYFFFFPKQEPPLFISSSSSLNFFFFFFLIRNPKNMALPHHFSKQASIVCKLWHSLICSPSIFSLHSHQYQRWSFLHIIHNISNREEMRKIHPYSTWINFFPITTVRNTKTP